MTGHPNNIVMLGVRIDDVRIDEALALIDGFIAKRGPHQIVTVNPEFVMEAQRNAVFQDVLQRADLAVPDGVGLSVVARGLGHRLRGRVPGVELVEAIAKRSAQHGYRVFLLGAAPSVAEQAAAVLARRYPGFVVAGCFAGSPRRDDEPEIRQRIVEARPDVLLVAYGAPAQDLWIARNQPAIQVPVAIGVGGTFDYLSGRVLRAPRWIRRIGLEWLFRVIRQPWRWKRIYTAVVRFPLAVARDQIRRDRVS